MKSATLRMLATLLVALRESERSSSAWDPYIGSVMTRSEDATGQAQCDSVVIIGRSDGYKWTTDETDHALLITDDEAAKIAKCFVSKDFDPFKKYGVSVAGQKYTFGQDVGQTAYAKKTGFGRIVMQSSGSAIIIAHTPEDAQSGQCYRAVDVIAQYMESMGY